MPSAVTILKGGRASGDVLSQQELATMQPIIEAVCRELGVSSREKARRDAVAERIVAAYRGGSRLPLNMVSAGLSEYNNA